MIHLIILATLAPAYDAAASGATLSGVIHGEKDKPLAGATVRIFTAKPRKGAGQL